MLVIRIRGSGVSTSSGGGIRTAVRLRAPRACHRHAAASRRIGLDGADPPDVVVADFSFQVCKQNDPANQASQSSLGLDLYPNCLINQNLNTCKTHYSRRCTAVPRSFGLLFKANVLFVVPSYFLRYRRGGIYRYGKSKIKDAMKL